MLKLCFIPVTGSVFCTSYLQSPVNILRYYGVVRLESQNFFHYFASFVSLLNFCGMIYCMYRFLDLRWMQLILSSFLTIQVILTVIQNTSFKLFQFMFG